MRGVVLNKKGTYNRCKLTRLVVDTEWEEKVWKDSWMPRGEPVKEGEEWTEWEGEECLAAVPKPKRPREDSRVAKKARPDPGVAWGEGILEESSERQAFLYSQGGPDQASSQSRIKVYTGQEWMCRELLKEAANSAVARSELLQGVAGWEEWQAEEEPVLPARSEREEQYLWAMLRVLDKESAGEERRANIKKKKMVTKARKKMGAGKDQPSIKDKLAKSKQLVGSRQDTTPAVPAPSTSKPTQLVSVAQLSGHSQVSVAQLSSQSQPTTGNRHTRAPLVTLGQSKGSPSLTSDIKRGGWGRHEHPWMNRVPEMVDESGGSEGTVSSKVLRGEGGVIAHTGSMSNIVQTPNDEVENEASNELCTLCLVCVQTCSCVYKSDRESANMKSVTCVDMKLKIHTECECASRTTLCTKCEQTGLMKNVQCVQAESSQPGASGSESQAVLKARKLCKPTFNITNIEGGRFSLRLNTNKSGKGGKEKEFQITNQIKSDLNMPEHYSPTKNAKNAKISKSKLPGETFNNIPIIQTPQKRKLPLPDSSVARLVCNFSERAHNLPGDYESRDSESPAKRRRVGGHRGQGQ